MTIKAVWASIWDAVRSELDERWDVSLNSGTRKVWFDVSEGCRNSTMAVTASVSSNADLKLYLCFTRWYPKESLRRFQQSFGIPRRSNGLIPLFYCGFLFLMKFVIVWPFEVLFKVGIVRSLKQGMKRASNGVYLAWRAPTRQDIFPDIFLAKYV